MEFKILQKRNADDSISYILYTQTTITATEAAQIIEEQGFTSSSERRAAIEQWHCDEAEVGLI